MNQRTRQSSRRRALVGQPSRVSVRDRLEARPTRRAFVLIVVVAILVLLALMGTAYIAMVRLDRVQITGSGAGGLVTGGSWVLQANQSMMDQSQSIAVTRMLNVIVEEIFDNTFVP